MNRLFVLVFGIGLVCLTGCETAHSVHARGVYTVAYSPEMKSAAFKLVGKWDTPKDTFAPNEVPVAVIRGYGDFEMDLMVVQCRTGKVVFSDAVRTGRGHGALQPLRLRVPGEYEVRALREGKLYDSYRFTVLPATSAAPRSAAPAGE